MVILENLQVEPVIYISKALTSTVNTLREATASCPKAAWIQADFSMYC